MHVCWCPRIFMDANFQWICRSQDTLRECEIISVFNKCMHIHKSLPDIFIYVNWEVFCTLNVTHLERLINCDLIFRGIQKFSKKKHKRGFGIYQKIRISEDHKEKRSLIVTEGRLKWFHYTCPFQKRVCCN